MVFASCFLVSPIRQKRVDRNQQQSIPNQKLNHFCYFISSQFLDNQSSPSRWLFLPSSIMDVIAINMMAIGDVLTKDQATKAILGSTTMIWCYLISIPLFKREMKTHQWIGIFLISVGGFVKVSIIVPGLFPNYVIHDYCTGADESL